MWYHNIFLEAYWNGQHSSIFIAKHFQRFINNIGIFKKVMINDFIGFSCVVTAAVDEVIIIELLYDFSFNWRAPCNNVLSLHSAVYLTYVSPKCISKCHMTIDTSYINTKSIWSKLFYPLAACQGLYKWPIQIIHWLFSQNVS